jgi:hypothetical protein
LEQLHHRYPSKINDVAFDSQSGLLALGFDGEVELIRLTTAQEISVSRPIVTPGGIVASTPGGTLVALRFRDDANPLLPLEILPCPYTRSVALSMDATRAAFFDCPEKKERALSVVALPGPAEAKKFEWEDQLPRRLVLSDDGRRLAAVFSEKPASAKQGQSPMGGNAESRLMMRFLWIEDGGQPVQKIKPIAIPPEMRFWEFARSGRAAWICAGENPASLQRADFDTGQWKEWPIPVGNGVTAFAVSPKESHLAVAETEEIGATATASARGGASRSVKVWDVKTKTAVTLRSRGGAGTMGTTSAMAFASDGSHLATADGATVRVWDLQGAEVARYVLPAPFAQLAFSQDGHRVVAVANRHVYVFPSDDGELLKTVCRVVGRDLTKKEWAQYVPNEPYIGVCEKDLAAAAAAR